MSKTEYDINDFLRAWKTHDKEWLKQRRKEWRTIKIQLDRMLIEPKLIELRKKDYKFLKNYFLTGKDHQERKSSEAPISLRGYDTQFKATLLLQFWLSPDHSQQCFDFLIQEFDKFYNTRWYYREAYVTYKNSIQYYQCEVERYQWNGETTEYNGPLFGDLNLEMPNFFKFTPEEEEKLFVSTICFEYVLIGFFVKGFENWSCYNPNNPMIHWIDEYIRFGFQRKRQNSDKKNDFYVLVSVVWSVIDKPEGRYPLQISVAQELKQKILEARENASKKTVKLIDKGIKRYKKGTYNKGKVYKGFLDDYYRIDDTNIDNL